MCMNISKEDIIRINKAFGGSLRSESSLDFALDMLNNKKFGNYRKLSYLIRAILVDHPFTDANKRTAAYIVLFLAEQEGKTSDFDLLLHHIVSIAKKNITDIDDIIWRLKNAIK